MTATDLLPRSGMSPALCVTRDGMVESVHLAHVVVATPAGAVTTVAGEGSVTVYPRSSFKPFQAAAARAQLGQAGLTPSRSGLAIGAASHSGSDDHQVEAAALLAQAGLDESALRCPAAWPADPAVRSDLSRPTQLSHNCSGKHALMLWAHTATGGDPADYLAVEVPLQQRVAAVLATVLGTAPTGPGVDGCGAPAWRCPLGALGRAYAHLIAGVDPDLAAVRDAMSAHPTLIGGDGAPDTALMWADGRVVAKRGADGVLGAGFLHPRHGALGVAVKVVDGGDRAAGPIASAVLRALGAAVPEALVTPTVLGGGVPHGALVPDPELTARTVAVFGTC